MFYINILISIEREFEALCDKEKSKFYQKF